MYIYTHTYSRCLAYEPKHICGVSRFMHAAFNCSSVALQPNRANETCLITAHMNTF